MFQRKAVEKVKTCLLFSITFLRKSCRLWDNVEKYYRSGQATDGNLKRRTHFEYLITNATDTLTTCNIFPMATLVTRTRLNITLYARLLSSLILQKTSLWLHFLLSTGRTFFSSHYLSSNRRIFLELEVFMLLMKKCKFYLVYNINNISGASVRHRNDRAALQSVLEVLSDHIRI